MERWILVDRDTALTTLQHYVSQRRSGTLAPPSADGVDACSADGTVRCADTSSVGHHSADNPARPEGRCRRETEGAPSARSPGGQDVEEQEEVWEEQITLTFERAKAVNILGWEHVAQAAPLPFDDRPANRTGGGSGSGGGEGADGQASGSVGAAGVTVGGHCLEGKVLVLESVIPAATARRLVAAGAAAVVMPSSEVGEVVGAAAGEEERQSRLREMYLAMTLGHSPAMAVAAANRGRADPVFTCLY